MNPFDKVMKRIRYRTLPGRQATNETAVQRFEALLGHRLPADYREFLLAYGLTAGRGTKFTPPDDPEEASSVDVFYGLTPGHSYDLDVNRSTFADRLPSHLLPIASGSGGQFLLAVSGRNTGAVYWWFTESGPVDSDDDLELISDNFAQFMEALVSEE
jgi:SMI1 / KNR4 family (SUKH-1)